MNRRSGGTHLRCLQSTMAMVLAGPAIMVAWNCTTACLAPDSSLACLSNLKAIGKAASLYAVDHDGYLPITVVVGVSWPSDGRSIEGRPDAWMQALLPYGGLKEAAFRCPAYDASTMPAVGVGNEPLLRLSYRQGGFLHPYRGFLRPFLRPSDLVTIEHALRLSLDMIENPRSMAYAEDALFQTVRNGAKRMETSHGDYIGRVFFDGHVAMAPRLDPYTADPGWRKRGS